MTRLKTLQPRVKSADLRRIRPLNGEQRRVSGRARISLKRRVWMRDGGQCCLCGRVVDLCDSELDHRLALQFGGGNEEGNLWTLCTECHQQKSAREVSTGQPDAEALSLRWRRTGPVTAPLLSEPGGGSVQGKKPIPPDTAPPLTQRKKTLPEKLHLLKAFFG
ncbi:TPA: HNH endonuclease [Escherichia coli]|nr:HNH endonuclease [Escherichia coli]HEL8126418.1 HNH endonuclease [Escherichia coli]HEL8385644.1 HNH endonuclease [Escherichia coli]HEL8735098.1 HNH endonuclease [Escherichia coli]HEL9994830.1 HNH endonuclease [Escherichia coli]